MTLTRIIAEQAVELSGLVPSRTTNDELIALAKQISAAQGPEIVTMQGFLGQWNHNSPDPATGSGHGPHAGMGMSGMVDAQSIVDGRQAEITQMRKMLEANP